MYAIYMYPDLYPSDMIHTYMYSPNLKVTLKIVHKHRVAVGDVAEPSKL